MKSIRETAERVVDDLPYRIVEEMGLGLTFRSCTCGQLPCARLRPLRDALEAARQNERERCAKIAETIPESRFDLDHEPARSEQQIRNRIAAAIRKED